MKKPIRGSCLCGGVRFEVDPPFLQASHCHCDRCRKHSGAGVCTQTRVLKEQFRLLQGEELVKVYGKGEGAVKAFCTNCGSSLFGSGLAGGLLAAYLGRRGYDVDLYERRADPREGNIVGGRSINLALSTRGIYALEQLGIADEVLRHAIPMRGRMIHDKSGALHFSPYDRDPNKFINSIGRA